MCIFDRRFSVISFNNCINGIPSYRNANDCQNITVTLLNNLIYIDHDSIITEVHSFLSEHHQFFNIQSHNHELKWNPIWIKHFNNLTIYSEKLPTLTKIISLFPDISSFFISIFYPGDSLIEHTSPSSSYYRYHYGLKIPCNDIGLKISGYDVKWQEKEGFIWDNTLSHSIWNHTSQPRIVICADITK